MSTRLVMEPPWRYLSREVWLKRAERCDEGGIAPWAAVPDYLKGESKLN